MSTMTPSHAALCALLLTATLAAPVSAQELTLQAELGVQYVTDASVDAISRSDYQTTTQLSAGWALDALSPDLRALAMFHLGSSGDQLRFGGDATTRWALYRVMLGVDYGPQLFGFLRPVARLGVGYAYQSLELITSGPASEDGAHDLTALGALGVEASVRVSQLTPVSPESPWAGLSLGAHTYLGYLYQGDADFNDMRPGEGALAEDDPWERAPTRLGTLAGSGVLWTLGVHASWAF